MLSDLGRLIINLLVWGGSGAFIGWLYARRDWRDLAPPGFFTRLRPRERRSGYERLLFVKAWKDRLPEAGTWFGGISKRRLPSRADGGMARFVAESLRAERVHLSFLGVFVVSLAWNDGWWMVGTVLIGTAVNVPCIIVARYNRVRLADLT
jgi:glycosyl-4,4'-diaponeurosporenoate acyltransferase